MLPISAIVKHASKAAGLLLGQQGAASPLSLDLQVMPCWRWPACSLCFALTLKGLHQHVLVPCRLYAFEAAGLLLGQEELPAEDQYALLVALLQPLVQQIERGLQASAASCEHKHWDECTQSAQL